MTGAPLPSTTRRTILASIAATLGTGSAAANAQAADPIDVDADNLVAGNERFTITLDGVPSGEIGDVAVTVGGVAFAVVEVLGRDPPVLAVNASNLVGSESIRGQDTVEVLVLIVAGGRKFRGTDESQVIAE